jgi:hypothetical protein
MGSRTSSAAPDFEYADDARAYRAGSGARQAQLRNAERIVAALISASGGPATLRFEQRQPTRAECRTDSLDFFASKGARWPGFRQPIVRARLAELGITHEQVASWAVSP